MKHVQCWLIGHQWGPDHEAGARHLDFATGDRTGRCCTHCGVSNDGDPYRWQSPPVLWVAVWIAPVSLVVSTVLADTAETRFAYIVGGVIAVMFALVVLLAARWLSYYARDTRRLRATNERLRAAVRTPQGEAGQEDL